MRPTKTVHIDSPPYCRTEIDIDVTWTPGLAGGAASARADLRDAVAELMEQIRDVGEPVRNDSLED